MLGKLRSLKNRCARRWRVKRLVWRVSLLSMIEGVKTSAAVTGRKNLRVKVIRVTKNMFRSR